MLPFSVHQFDAIGEVFSETLRPRQEIRSKVHYVCTFYSRVRLLESSNNETSVNDGKKTSLLD